MINLLNHITLAVKAIRFTSILGIQVKNIKIVLVQTGKTGALAEYGALEETIQPAILTLITQWISKQ